MCRSDFASPFGRSSEVSSGEGLSGGGAGSLTRSNLSRRERLFIVATLIALTSGCVQEMADQPLYGPLEPSTAFDNGMSSREPVPGTVARGQLQLDEPFFSGKANGQLVSELPAPALADRTIAELLARGQERYNVFCSHCHGRVGGGIGGDAEYVSLTGMVVERGFPAPPTYHQERLRRAPIGHFFDVITNGLGRMPPHGYMIEPQDRWTIAAYIRALQLSQYAPTTELTAADFAQLNVSPGD
jgi:mono/diheme cytochrome c family protein